LATGLGHIGINKLPGCLEIQVDEHWWFAINAHREATDTTEGSTVPPGSIYFVFNGWPAGFVGMNDGVLCAGAAGNEEELLKAIDAAILRLMPEVV
jgi:hypothetical protein